jgi:hypothetical protein
MHIETVESRLLFNALPLNFLENQNIIYESKIHT